MLLKPFGFKGIDMVMENEKVVALIECSKYGCLWHDYDDEKDRTTKCRIMTTTEIEFYYKPLPKPKPKRKRKKKSTRQLDLF